MKNPILKASVAVSLFLATILTFTPFASADAVTDAFDDGETALGTYIAAGIAVIVALLGLGVGLLVKYLRKAVRAA